MPTIIPVKYIPQIIADDKLRLQERYGQHLKLDLSVPTLLPDELSRLSAEIRTHLKNPPEPVELDKKTLEEMFDAAKIEVEEIWGAKLPVKPRIEVLPYARFIARSQALENKTSKDLGTMRRKIRYLDWQIAPHQGVMLFPTRYSFEEKGVKNEVPYDRVVLEQDVASATARLFCRQLREEWKQGYVKKILENGPIYGARSASLLRVLDALTQDILVQKHPARTLYAFMHKYGDCITDMSIVNDYRALQSLSNTQTLGELAKTELMFVANPMAQDEEEFNHTLMALPFKPNILSILFFPRQKEE